MTSLQRAASSAQAPVPPTELGKAIGLVRPRSYVNRNSGIFEASFNGLDISEFGVYPQSGTSSMARTSAAAELMRIKAAEALKLEKDLWEEAIMEEQASIRTKEHKEKTDSTKAEKAQKTMNEPSTGTVGPNRPIATSEFHGSLYSSLVAMHGSDECGARSQFKRKLQRRNAFWKKSGHCRSTHLAARHALTMSRTRNKEKGLVKKPTPSYKY